MPADLIIYAVIAAGLVFWLRSILGTHSESDDKIAVSRKIDALPDDEAEAVRNGLPLSEESETAAPDKQFSVIEDDKSGVMMVENKTAENGLRDIMEADKAFDLKFFLNAVQDVFAMVVESFADGDREALADLLAPDVYKIFDGAINEREGREEKAVCEIHAIHEAHIIEAKLEKRRAFITVKFAAEESSVVYDKDGEIIEGHPERTRRMNDIWTFSRDLKSRDPRWWVMETRGGFDGDNDFIPDSE